MLFAAEHSSAATPSIAAPASTRAMRPEAPARDSESNVQFTDQLPPVIIRPHFSWLSG